MSDPVSTVRYERGEKEGARFYLYRWVEDPKATNHDPLATGLEVED
jgi:hypothetical protein